MSEVGTLRPIAARIRTAVVEPKAAVTQAPAGTKISKLAICGTPDHTAMRQAFVTWAPKHQDDWTKPRAVGVVKALRESWPCPAP
jgi:Rap1a immunity proteins